MRVSRDKAAENRERIIDTASQLFREKGFDGVGVDAPPGEGAREPPASAVEGKELHRQLSAVLSIDDKRLRGLIIQLLKVLSELGGAKLPFDDEGGAGSARRP